jgi:hypothetical protein
LNRYLLLSAAALLTGTTAANASEVSFTFGTSNGAPYCDGGTIVTGVGGNKAVWSWTHTNTNCASGTSEGQGLAGKSGKKSIAVLSDTYDSKQHVTTESVSYVLPQKLKTGGHWEMWVEAGGVSSYEGAHGVIIVGAPHQTSGKSTLAAVTKLVQQGRESVSTRGTAR